MTVLHVMPDPTLAAIREFSGHHNFLSNFYPCQIRLDNDIYPSVEHAYQAAKTFDRVERLTIRDCGGAGTAKHLGRPPEKGGIITLRRGWEELKLDIMLGLLRQKFSHLGMRRSLLMTGDRELIEGNWWKDRYWGVYKGEGDNHLGRLIMQVRKEIREQIGKNNEAGQSANRVASS